MSVVKTRMVEASVLVIGAMVVGPPVNALPVADDLVTVRDQEDVATSAAESAVRVGASEEETTEVYDASDREVASRQPTEAQIQAARQAYVDNSICLPTAVIGLGLGNICAGRVACDETTLDTYLQNPYLATGTGRPSNCTPDPRPGPHRRHQRRGLPSVPRGTPAPDRPAHPTPRRHHPGQPRDQLLHHHPTLHHHRHRPRLHRRARHHPHHLHLGLRRRHHHDHHHPRRALPRPRHHPRLHPHRHLPHHPHHHLVRRLPRRRTRLATRPGHRRHAQPHPRPPGPRSHPRPHRMTPGTTPGTTPATTPVDKGSPTTPEPPPGPSSVTLWHELRGRTRPTDERG
ncbi:hypothetical protein QE405_000549 [Nocardioides zeae]|uniref:Uncharacterized protein n=1 Tax=Nocardioides zeae TaxID=1457234 RepID=A0AAJ1TWE8_9ACTN|nr:hypothetical protein [Nocardioides zeae]